MVKTILLIVVAVAPFLFYWWKTRQSRQQQTFEVVDPMTPRHQGLRFCRQGGCLADRWSEWGYCRRHLISAGYLKIRPYEFDFENKPPMLQSWKREEGQ